MTEPRPEPVQPVTPEGGTPPISPVDVLNDEVVSPPPPEQPVPHLVPLYKMPFKERAEFIRAFKQLTPKLKALELLKDQSADAPGGVDEETNYDLIAEAYEAFSEIENLLGMAAADTYEWESWEGKYDENRLTELFNRYMKEFQVPEASRSAKS